MGSILQALKGAKVELAQAASLREKARLSGFYIKIITQEVIGTLLLAPYGYRAWRLHRYLPQAKQLEKASQANGRVYLLKDVRYGQADRNTCDVYIPGCSSSSEAGKGGPCPVAIFCHGGIWATGAKWQFAPIAACLAQRGIVTCVLQYSLYPPTLVPEMVEEVAAAINWLSKRCPEYGGSSQRISLVGHSAGAQLAIMATLKLIEDNKKAQAVKHKLPAKVVGMAGCYDIGLHYDYEVGRGVAYLSTMARAMGGSQGFDPQSPAVILNSIATAASIPKSSVPQMSARQMRAWGRGAPDASIIGSTLYKDTAEEGSSKIDLKQRGADSDPTLTLPLNLKDLEVLPEIVIMSSKADVTVPWVQSSQMHAAIKRCKCQSRHLFYGSLGHGDFVIDWQFDENHQKRLSGFAEDLVKIILDEDE